MLTGRQNKNWVLWYVTIAFVLMIALVWLVEFTGVKPLLFGGERPASDWRNCALDTILLIVVWSGVFVATRRLLAHLLYLKGLLRVCAWCRRVNYKGDWMRVEDYFEQGFHVESTHGMCPECMKKFEADYEEQKRKQAAKA